MNKQELEKIKQKALEEHIPIIMDETLEVIEKYLNKNKPNRILEIGTAVGYSAICFTQFLAENGVLDTIERETDRVEEAKKNIKLAEVEDKINIYEGDAVEILPTLNNQYDVVFIDAAKGKNMAFFKKFSKNLTEDGFIVTDNIKFHGYVDKDEKEIKTRNLRGLVRKIKEYIGFLKDNNEYKTVFYDVGDGISVSQRKD